LFDSKGQPVEKTEYGKQFGRPLTQKEIHEWFRPIRGYVSSAWILFPSGSSQHWTDIRWFSIPRAFKIMEAGEYVLHLRMRLIQTGVSNSAGTVRTNMLDPQYFAPKTESIYFQSIWLPEVVAKFQIQSTTVPTANAPPIGHTNSSTN
jgi:hypothetical protein